MRTSYIIAAIVLVVLATSFAIYSDWLWSNSVVLSGNPPNSPEINAVRPEYWTIFILTVALSIVFYIIAGTLLWKGVKDTSP